MREISCCGFIWRRESQGGRGEGGREGGEMGRLTVFTEEKKKKEHLFCGTSSCARPWSGKDLIKLFQVLAHVDSETERGSLQRVYKEWSN